MKNIMEETIAKTIINDTVYIKTEVIDTIYNKVNVFYSDTIAPDLIKVYEKLITAQDDKFDYLLVSIGIIVTVLVILITFFNFSIAQKIFEKDAKTIFDSEKDKLKKYFDLELIKVRNEMEYKNCEAFAAILETSEHFADDRHFEVMKYIVTGLKHVIAVNDIENIIGTLRTLKNKIEATKEDQIVISIVEVEYKKFCEILDTVPVELNQSKIIESIKNSLNEIRDREGANNC
jgi:hypothetical protein